MDDRVISISVVSHEQIQLVRELLQDIQRYCTSPAEVILTINVPEQEDVNPADYDFPLKVIRNKLPKGFGANHDDAFLHAEGSYFCVLNPDIRLEDNPFPALISCLQTPRVVVAGPLVLSPNGKMEDSARQFPSPLTILGKAIGKCREGDYAIGNETVFPDWIAGMFMLFRRDAFREVGGFDRKYFLYYEDVDLCARLRLRGYQIALCPAARVAHEAQRASHRKMRFFGFHVASILRFFTSSVYWRLQFRGQRNPE